MFVQIKDNRIKLASISRYKDMGLSVSKNQYCIAIRINNQWEHFYFDTENEKNTVLENLDKATKTVAL